jgi:hypothetical protein
MSAIKLELRTPDDRPIRGKTLVRFPASRVQKVLGHKPAVRICRPFIVAIFTMSFQYLTLL